MCCAYIPRGDSPAPFPSPFSIGDMTCPDPFSSLESFGSLCSPFGLDDFKEISTRPAGARVAKGTASRSNTLDTDAILGSLDFTTTTTTVHVYDGETAANAVSCAPLVVTYIDCGEMTTLTRVVDDMLRSNGTGQARDQHQHIPVIFASSASMLPTPRARIEDHDGYVRIHARFSSLRMRAVYAFRVDVRPGVSCVVIVPRFEHHMLRFAAGGVCFECTTVLSDGCPEGQGVCACVTLSGYTFDMIWGPAGSSEATLDARASLCMENAPSAVTRESIRIIIDSSSSDEETKLVAKTAVTLIPRHKLGLIRADVSRALQRGRTAITTWTNAFSKMFVI